MAQDMAEVFGPEGPMSLASGGQVYDFDLNDFGVQPDYPKEFLDGKVLIVRGVSESTFEGEYDRPARSLLHSWPADFYATDGRQHLAPYGALMSDDSPAIRQTREMQTRGKLPFVARLQMRDSKAHKGQTYWTLERAELLQFDEHGTLVDPNPEPTAEPKGKAK